MTEIEWVWEGTLESPAASYAITPKGALPGVRIGKPAWWSDETFGTAWIPPAGGARYGLARFAFALMPGERQTILRAELSVGLKALGGSERPTFFDLVPRTTTVKETGELKAVLGPAIKLPGDIEFSLASIESTEHVQRLVPVLSVSGIGHSVAQWACQSHEAHPLTGDQLVYAVIELPPGAVAARATLALTVQARGPFGIIPAILPQAAQEHLNVTLGARDL